MSSITDFNWDKALLVEFGASLRTGAYQPDMELIWNTLMMVPHLDHSARSDIRTLNQLMEVKERYLNANYHGQRLFRRLEAWSDYYHGKTIVTLLIHLQSATQQLEIDE